VPDGDGLEQAQPFGQDVLGCIQIAVMGCATGTSPGSISKREGVVDSATPATQAARPIEAPNLDQVFVLPIRFVGEKLPKSATSGI